MNSLMHQHRMLIGPPPDSGWEGQLTLLGLLLFSRSVMSDSATPTDRNTPGFPVLYCLLEFAQTHVHWVGDAIQRSHPLSSPSLPVLSLPQHQGLFQWVGSSHQVARISELQLFSVVYFHFHFLLLSLLSVGVKSKKWSPRSFVGIQFHPFAWGCPAFLTPFVEAVLPAFILYSRLPCGRSVDRAQVYFWVLLHWSLSVFMPAPYCCDCCSFAMHFEIRMYDAFSFALLFSRLLWQFRVFCGSIQIWGLFFSVSVEKMPLVFWQGLQIPQVVWTF